MNQDPPKNARHRIGLYIEIPGLKMTPLSALCHAEVMRRGIRCVLKHDNVLWDEPLSPAATDEVLDVVNQVARFQNGSAVEPPSAGDALKPLFTFIHRIIRERITEPGVQCFAYFVSGKAESPLTGRWGRRVEGIAGRLRLSQAASLTCC